MVIIFNSLVATVAMFAACAFVAHILGWDKEGQKFNLNILIMDKDKIIVSVVIDKQALVDSAFGISTNPSDYIELKRVIDGTNQFTRDVDEFDDERKKEKNTELFANVALDIILSDNPELGITKRLKAQKNAYLDKIKKLDELKEKVKSGEMPGVEGLRMLLKIIEEGE